MKFSASVLVLALSLTVANAQQCPSNFLIQGSSTVKPLAEAWVDDFNSAFNCPTDGSGLTVVGGGSSAGARGVCGIPRTAAERGDDFDEQVSEIGNMSREWKVGNTQEATTPEEDYIYHCNANNREAIQLDVAIDGLSIAVLAGSAAANCVAALGGLSMDQLRWMYSNQPLSILQQSGGFDAAVHLPGSDGDDDTHLWSELANPSVPAEVNACPEVEILPSGADQNSGTFDYFKEVTFEDFNPIGSEDFPFCLDAQGQRIEGIDTSSAVSGGRGNLANLVCYINEEDDDALVSYLGSAGGAAVSYFGYAYVAQNPSLIAVPIIARGATNAVAPTATTIFDGSYVPFGRRIYMNVLNNQNTLQEIRPFFTRAFSDVGTDLVSGDTVGYVAIPEYEQEVMLARIGAGYAASDDYSAIECGPGGDFSIGGSSTVRPVAEIWGGIYQTKCHEHSISVQGGGSSRGARRVCNVNSGDSNPAYQSPVDIGDMSRDWKVSEEATTNNGYVFDCAGSSRSAVQIEVAIDGLTVAFALGSTAGQCIESLNGGGLTIQQLRWMFSSFNEDQLEGSAEFVTAEVIPSSDSNPNTHLWRELADPNDQAQIAACPPVEIKPAGADVLSGTFDYFREVILNDGEGGETFPFNSRQAQGVEYFDSEEDEDIVTYLLANSEAVGYFGFSYFATRTDLGAAKIENDQLSYVAPSSLTVEDGSYNPLSRRIYMNLYNNNDSLAKTVPFLKFGLSNLGTELVQFTGYSPIPKLEQTVMLARLGEGPVVPSNFACGPSSGVIKIRGSSTVRPVAEVWGGIYEVGCRVEVQVNGGGSSIGADTVCGGGVEPTDIGNMSREWKTSEAAKVGEYGYDCLEHDTSRSAAQMEVAIDGLTVVTATTGAAKECVDLLDGLTLDQLRWIYSSYTEDELEAQGWDPSSVPNSDGNDDTHKWSELDSGCADVEIHITGADSLSGTYEYFKETVLPDLDNGETFDGNRPKGYFNSELDEEIIAEVLGDTNSIGYFGYSYYFLNQDTLNPVPIENGEGDYVIPDETTVADGTYEPLARKIFMNLYTNSDSLEKTIPFLRFGYSSQGSELVSQTGYVPLPSSQVQDMLARLDALESGNLPNDDDDDDDGLSIGAIVGIVIAVVVVLLVVGFVASKFLCNQGREDFTKATDPSATDHATNGGDDNGGIA